MDRQMCHIFECREEGRAHPDCRCRRAKALEMRMRVEDLQQTEVESEDLLP